MPVPALMAIGLGMRAFGQLISNFQQADAERRNAEFYQYQADYARESAIRQEVLANRNYTKLSGAQLSAYAKGGVDISGSAASVVAETFTRKLEEMYAIKQKGELEYKLAYLRSQEAKRTADRLTDPLFNILQFGGTALTSGAADSLFSGENSGIPTKLLGQSSGPGTYDVTPAGRSAVSTG